MVVSCRVGAAWQMLVSSLNPRSLAQIHNFRRISQHLSSTGQSELHVVHHATSVDLRCAVLTSASVLSHFTIPSPSKRPCLDSSKSPSILTRFRPQRVTRTPLRTPERNLHCRPPRLPIQVIVQSQRHSKLSATNSTSHPRAQNLTPRDQGRDKINSRERGGRTANRAMASVGKTPPLCGMTGPSRAECDCHGRVPQQPFKLCRDSRRPLRRTNRQHRLYAHLGPVGRPHRERSLAQEISQSGDLESTTNP